MTRRRLIAIVTALLAAASVGEVLPADDMAQYRRLIEERLVYPRQARYVLPPRLPVDTATAEQNAEWMRVADALKSAGIVKATMAAGKTVLEPAENSTDAVVPSVSLRYETTALNIVLGYWDIEARRATHEGNVTRVQGTRSIVRRTRAYGVVLQALGSERAASFSDSTMGWEIAGSGASASVRETPR